MASVALMVTRHWLCIFSHSRFVTLAIGVSYERGEGQFNLHHLILINDPKPICHPDCTQPAMCGLDAIDSFCQLSMTKLVN